MDNIDDVIADMKKNIKVFEKIPGYKEGDLDLIGKIAKILEKELEN